MTSPAKTMTATEFDEWVLLPENRDSNWEYIGGEIFEVVSNNYSSEIAAEILFCIKLFLKENNLGGRVTGADGGYIVAEERYIPDVAYISSTKQAEPSRKAYNPNPPDLAVEVISPSDNERKLSVKIANYLSAGTLVWIVRPEDKEVEVFASNQPVKILGENDILEGGNVLEGFRLPVKDIFGKEKDSQ